jgi:hypothetical protein
MVLLLSPAGRAELFGYAEARYVRIQGLGSYLPEYVTAQRLRPTMVEELDSVEGVSFTVTPELQFRQFEDDPPEFMETDDYLTVERLYADIDAGPARVRLGRQAVNWGSALVWNPTDLFQEVFLTDYWAERKGLNALRVYVPMENDFRLTAVMSTGDTVFFHNRYALKASLARWEADVSAVWMDDTINDRLVWGLDVKGTAVVGYWVEAAAFAPKDQDLDSFEQAVVGIDYSFPVRSTLYLAAQYYYDGSGKSEPELYDWPGLFAGRRTTLGMHYANLLATLAWNSDLSLAVNAIYNLDDDSAIISPYLTYTYEDFRISAGANITAGSDGGEFRPRPDQNPLELVPYVVYYVWGRWYL